MDPYFTAVWVHILSSTILFGTGIAMAFQMVWAMRIGKVVTIHAVASGVVMADWIFTVPAGLAQPLTGLWLIHLSGHSMTAPWLVAADGLYLLEFFCWVSVAYLQIGIRNPAAQALT
jgi:uncharacterized membrane protein